MAQTSRDFGEFLRRSLRAAAASVAVRDDGLDGIWIRLARVRSSAVADDREISLHRARSPRARQLGAGSGHGGCITTHDILSVRGLGPHIPCRFASPSCRDRLAPAWPARRLKLRRTCARGYA
jgi:hypothetical protein